MTLSADFTFGNTDTRALYFDSESDLPPNESSITDHLKYCSVKNIVTKLMRNVGRSTEEGPCQQRLWIMMTYLAIGRDGEIKFQNYNDRRYDPLLGVLDIVLPGRGKKIKKMTRMPTPQDRRYQLDIYYSLACFYALEAGLYRNATDPNESI